MYPSQDKLQYPIPGRKYKFLDKDDIILATDLYRSFTEGYSRNWQLAGDVATYWVGKTVSEFAWYVYKTHNPNDYLKAFEILRDVTVTIKM